MSEIDKGNNKSGGFAQKFQKRSDSSTADQKGGGFSDKFQKRESLSTLNEDDKGTSDHNNTGSSSSSMVEKLMSSNSANFRIVQGMADYSLPNGDVEKRAAWHIVYLTDPVTFDGLIKKNVDKIDVQDYGKILESGWGEKPDREILSKIRKRFNMSDDDNDESESSTEKQ